MVMFWELRGMSQGSIGGVTKYYVTDAPKIMKAKSGVMAEMLYELLQGRGQTMSGDLQIKDAYTYTYLISKHESTVWTQPYG